MRSLALICLCLLMSTAAVAGKPTPAALGTPWAVELVGLDGKYVRLGGFATREACEAATPAVLAAYPGRDPHCIKWNSNSCRYERSADPAYHGGEYRCPDPQDPVYRVTNGKPPAK
jgi:hypothetical protein